MMQFAKLWAMKRPYNIVNWKLFIRYDIACLPSIQQHFKGKFMIEFEYEMIVKKEVFQKKEFYIRLNCIWFIEFILSAIWMKY